MMLGDLVELRESLKDLPEKTEEMLGSLRRIEELLVDIAEHIRSLDSK